MSDGAANSAGKQRGRPFRKGMSGNPRGKPAGTRHRTTQLAEKLLSEDVEGVVRSVLNAARGGDMTAARLVLERILPVRKGKPAIFDIPKIEKPADVVAATGALLTAMATGKLTPEEASAAASVIEAHRRVIETADLDARLAAVEAKLHEQRI
jgi:hypothetical protein